MFDRLVVSFLVDEVAGGFFVSVPPGYVAAVYDWGRGVLKHTWGPGLHFKLPFWQKAKLFNAQTLEYLISTSFNAANKESLGDEPITATTQDGHQVTIQGSILFKIDKDAIVNLWENIGEDFVSKIVRPFSRSRIRQVISQVTNAQLTSYRAQVEGKIKDELESEFRAKGLIVEGVLLSEISNPAHS
jgi:regulator of protease activity HflC (stomatin/prohibitin superfamily)